MSDAGIATRDKTNGGVGLGGKVVSQPPPSALDRATKSVEMAAVAWTRLVSAWSTVCEACRTVVKISTPCV